MSRSVRINESLFLKIQIIANTNGISVKGYVNDLLEKTVNAEESKDLINFVNKDYDEHRILNDKRSRVADETFATYDFGKAHIESHSVWEIVGDTYRKDVFYKLPKDPRDTPTHMRVFRIEFREGTADVAQVVESISLKESKK